jgi:hypothetical protein
MGGKFSVSFRDDRSVGGSVSERVTTEKVSQAAGAEPPAEGTTGSVEERAGVGPAIPVPARAVIGGPQPTPTGRDLPLMATWNCQTLDEQRATALILYWERGRPAFVCLQEVWKHRMEVSRMMQDNQYAFYSKLRPDPDGLGVRGGGVGILVDDRAWGSVPVPVTHTFQNGEEVMVVDIVHKESNEPWRVASVYLPPSNRTKCNIIEVIRVLTDMRVHVIAGDMNARIQSWDKNITDRRDAGEPATSSVNNEVLGRGLDMLAAMDDFGWSNLHSTLITPIATNINHDTTTDHILVKDGIKLVGLRTHSLGEVSDHYYLEAHTDQGAKVPRYRRVKPIRWDKVTAEIKAEISQFLAETTGGLTALQSRLRTALERLPKGSILIKEPDADPSNFMEKLIAGSPDVNSDAELWKMAQQAFDERLPDSPLEVKDETTGVSKLWATSRAKARIFNKTFCRKHASPLDRNGLKFPTLQGLPKPVLDGQPAPAVTKWEVIAAFQKLRPGGTPDDVGISPRLLLEFKEVLAPLIAKGLTALLRGEEPIPNSWRECTFIALLKPGKKPTDPESYRPVAITSLLCRLCERVLAARLMALWRNKLHPRQYGFREMRNTTDALAAILDEVLNGISSKQRVMNQNWFQGNRTLKKHIDVTGVAMIGLVDMSDAFSKVPHPKLMDALDRFETPTYLKKFVWDWLTDRKGCTCVNGTRSEFEKMEAGVPQGSVLGPILFLAYIDDLLCVLDKATASISNGCSQDTGIPVMKLAAYADDITMVIASHAPWRIAGWMRQWCKRLSDWAVDKGMTISKKTEFMWVRNPQAQSVEGLHNVSEFKMDGKETERGHLYKIRIGDLSFEATEGTRRILGVMTDTYLNFSDHVEKVANRAELWAERLRILGKVVHPKYCLSILSSVATTMLYASEVWGHRVNEGQWKRLESALAATCKAALGLYPSVSHANALALANTDTLAHLFESRALKEAARRSAAPQAVSTYALLSGRFEPCAFTPGLRQISVFKTPLNESVDKIIFFADAVDPTKKKDSMSTEELLQCNQKRHRQMLDAISAQSYVLEGWSDGSVLDPMDDGANRVARAGGATVIYPPGDEPKTVDEGGRIIKMHSAPRESCSFTAEISSGIELIYEALRVAKEWKASHVGKPLSAILCTDSQSWLKQAATGPLKNGSFAPQLWAALEALSAECEKVVLGFKYSHCEDPHGDEVDRAAGEASRTCHPTEAWHTDWDRKDQAGRDQAGWKYPRNTPGIFVQELRKLMLPEGTDGPLPQIPFPSTSLRRADARELNRLRSGVWWRLGEGAVHFGVGGEPCKHCGVFLERGDGRPIRHLFECPGNPAESAGVQMKDLMSKDDTKVRAVIRFCQTFDVSGSGLAQG